MLDSETKTYRTLLTILGIINWIAIFFSAALTVLSPEQQVNILFFEDVMHQEVFFVSVLFFGMVVLPLLIKEYGWENLFEKDFKERQKRKQSD